MRIKRKYAFTLSELLIALGIIGIIAVLTVPFVSKNIFNHSYKAKAESTREMILASINNVFMKERVNSIQDSSVYTNKHDFFDKYIKTSKACGTSSGECFAGTYKTDKGDKTVSGIFAADDAYYVSLANGASVAVLTGSSVPEGQAYVIVDVNGKSAPNTMGVDLCIFNMHQNGTSTVLGDDEAIIAYNNNEIPDTPEDPTPNPPDDNTPNTHEDDTTGQENPDEECQGIGCGKIIHDGDPVIGDRFDPDPWTPPDDKDPGDLITNPPQIRECIDGQDSQGRVCLAEDDRLNNDNSNPNDNANLDDPTNQCYDYSYRKMHVRECRDWAN